MLRKIGVIVVFLLLMTATVIFLLSKRTFSPDRPTTQPVQLTLLSWRQEDSDAFDTIFQEHHIRNPHIKVVPEFISDEKYEQAIQIRMSSGSLISDIVMIKADRDLFLSIANRNELVDLSGEAFVQAYPEEKRILYQENKRQYGLPYTSNVLVAYYNRDTFEALELSPPVTWEEALRVCESSVEDGMEAIVFGAEQGRQFNTAYLPIFLSNLSIYQNPMYFMLDLEERKVRCDDQVILSYLALMEQLTLPGYLANANLLRTQDDAIELLMDGKAAILWADTSLIHRIEQLYPDNEIGFFPFPVSDKGAVACESIGAVLAVDAKSAHRQEALSLMEYLSTPEVAGMYGNATSQLVLVENASISNLNIVKIQYILENATLDPAVYMNEYDRWYRSPFNDMTARLIDGQPISKVVEEGQKLFDDLRIPTYQTVGS